MLRLAVSLRYVMLFASLGAVVGSLLMLWKGCARVLWAAQNILSAEDTKTVIAAVMSGTDAFLFSIVLIIFAYTIAFGFVFDLKPEDRATLPAWMRLSDLHEMKKTMVSVVLVYLVVDFATDWPESSATLTWEMLVKPISIFLIAAAFHFFAQVEQTPRT